MTSILQGGKVYLEGSDYSVLEGPEDKPWGRLVIVPSQNLWAPTPGVGPTVGVPFLTRAEFNPIANPEFNVQKSLDAIQDECYMQLYGYKLPSMSYAQTAMPVWQNRPPQPLPLWDEERRLYFTSAEWRFEIAGKTPPP
jgi:hypothetical protein